MLMGLILGWMTCSKIRLWGRLQALCIYSRLQSSTLYMGKFMICEICISQAVNNSSHQSLQFAFSSVV